MVGGVLRRAHVEASSVSHLDSSVTQHQVLGFNAHFGLDQQVSEAEITVPTLTDPDVDHFMGDRVTVTGGAGANIGATRFVGYVRDISRENYPRSVTLKCKGPLTFAQEYENPTGIGLLGGLRLQDILAAIGIDSRRGTDQEIIRGVLNLSGVAALAGYSDANIGGTGRMMGQANPDAWLWNAGVPTDPGRPFWAVKDKGQSAMDYIAGVDAISAFADWVTNPSSPTGGFYRTYDSLNGIPRRALMGGRPRGTADFTFTEGVDILKASPSSRRYPSANYVVIHGYDHGGAFGQPLGSVAYAFAGSNPFMSGQTTDSTPSSALIEWATEAEAVSYGASLGESDPVGMTCEMVSKARMLDVNRIIVGLSFSTALDYVMWPGQTHLITGMGGDFDRLGIGEKLWLQHLDIDCTPSGGVLVWSQTMRYLGGGSPDSGLDLPGS